MKTSPCVFVGQLVIVLCCADDLPIMGVDEDEMKKLKNLLTGKLPVNDLGKAMDFLWVKIIQIHDYIALAQRKQVQNIVDELANTESRK